MPTTMPTKMPTTTPKTIPEIPEWWPKRVQAWGSHEFANLDEQDERWKELERLITDERMKRVKVLLTTPPKRRNPKIPEIPDENWVPAEYLDCFDDPLICFLLYAWGTRGFWRSMIGRLPDNREAELTELATSCKSLIVHLKREHFAATYALQFTEPEVRFFRARPRYLNLLEMLHRIAGTVDHSGKWLESGLFDASDEELRDLLPVVHPYAYAPQDVENREQIYVSRSLSKHTQKSFGLLHHEAVAITIAVLFELDDPKGKLAGTVEERWKTNPI